MLAFVIVLQVLVALFLIMVVLLQPGNRGGASAALGGDFQCDEVTARAGHDDAGVDNCVHRKAMMNQ